MTKMMKVMMMNLIGQPRWGQVLTMPAEMKEVLQSNLLEQ